MARSSERRRIDDRRYEDRYRDRYDRYRTDRAGDFERGYEEGLKRGRADAEGVNGASSSELDGQLDGASVSGSDGGPEPIRFSAAEAFRTCTLHARRALSDRGFILSAPASPETSVDNGGAWKMTATVVAANDRGESWNRAMVCEADSDRVYLLELI